MTALNRKIYGELLAWKGKPGRKPIILFGARQVGKTFTLTKQFGPNEFSTYHVFNFAKDREVLDRIFGMDLNPKRILEELSLIIGRDIEIEKDLIIFDEVQESLRAVESLKYFNETYPESFIIATGSMLRVKLMMGEKKDQEQYFNYPVGKVTEMHLYPLSFDEFLWSSSNQVLLNAFNKLDRSLSAHEKLLEVYSDYLFVGGMPEVVSIWFASEIELVKRTLAVRDLQNELLSAYSRDFLAKGNVVNGSHLNLVYDAIYTHIQHALVHEESNERFKFKGVIPGKSRFEELKSVMNWLDNAGLLHKIYVIDSDPVNSPEAFIKHNIFKLIPHDVGLANAKMRHSYKEIRLDELGFVKGVLAELFVALELISSSSYKNKQFVSWRDGKGLNEIEFILKDDDLGVYPIEVKGGKNIKAKSLSRYCELFKPKLAVKLSSRAGSLAEENILNIPIYYASKHIEVIKNIKKNVHGS